jgi:hypothetical protein
MNGYDYPSLNTPLSIISVRALMVFFITFGHYIGMISFGLCSIVHSAPIPHRSGAGAAITGQARGMVRQMANTPIAE